MLGASALQAWDRVHRWSSLICTMFLFMLCVTGLPLIFLHEIDTATGAILRSSPAAAGAAVAELDTVLRVAQNRHPDKRPLFASQEPDDDGVWFVTLGGSSLAQVAVDARSTAVLAEPVIGRRGLLGVIRALHVDLFAGLAGRLFLAVMGALFLISLASGVVLYAPFMRKRGFGDVRRGRRIRWLDIHNLAGIATLVWAAVVGTTGVINCCADLLTRHWQAAELHRLLPPGTPLAEPISGGAERALQAARRREPALRVAFIALPGSAWSSSAHYVVFMRGVTPLTARLVRPVWVDARSGAVLDSRPLPWYLTALFVSQPLHFGDYGGLPLKILWAAFDAVTLVVVGGGLYLWVRRPNRRVRSASRGFG